MATKASIKAAVKKLGGTMEELSGAIFIDAPAGKLWDATINHTLNYTIEDDFPMSRLWAEAENDLSYGLMDCDREDCDICPEFKAKQAKPSSYYKHRPSAQRAARDAREATGQRYIVLHDTFSGWFISPAELGEVA